MRGLLVIAGVLATAPPAWAKYDPCGHVAVIEPAGPVPRNAKLWLWRSGGGERLRIRGPGLDRALAPPIAGTSRGLAAFDPGLLGRRGSYRIELVDGHHAWTLGELATGRDVDHRPPPPPRLHALAITQRLGPRAPGSDDDGPPFDVPASDLATAIDLSDDTVALDVTFDDSAEHFLVPREDPGLFGHDRCVPGRRFRVGARICMSIRAIDLAGNHSAPATRCTIVGGRIGDTARTAHDRAWLARRPRPADRPDGRLALAALVGLAAWAGGRLASRRLPAAHAPA